MAKEADVKIIMLGREYVGKTSLVESYINGEFKSQPTLGLSTASKRVLVQDEDILLRIWDTAGSERYQKISRRYYKGAKAAVICFDITDETSFESAKFWVNDLKELDDECPIYLCATKTDLLDKCESSCISSIMIESYADEIGAKYRETSAKTGYNIDALFQGILEDACSNL